MARRIRYDAWSATDGRRSRHDGDPAWISPWYEPGFGFADLVSSWRVDTEAGSWAEIAVQRGGEQRWHTLAHWESGRRAAHRTSLGDDPEVDTDIWRPTGGADAYRLRVTLHPSSRTGRLPTLGCVGAVVSAGEVRSTTSAPLRRVDRVLDVPRLSQMTWAEVGGRGWCSPTAVSMVLAHAGTLPPGTDSGSADVAAAAAEVADPAYGEGNWSFNTAWAAQLTGHAFVTRLHDLRDAERFVDAGIPLVVSVAHRRGELRGAPTRGTAGHLVVVRGFTAGGDVVANDPAAPTARSVRRTYDRGELEHAWLHGSGGLVYVVHHEAQALPSGGRGAWLSRR